MTEHGEKKSRLSDPVKVVITAAGNEAILMGHEWIGTAHLLLGLIAEGSIVETMRKTGFNPDIDMARALTYGLFRHGRFKDHPLTARAKFIIEHATAQALARGDDAVYPTDLYGALLRFSAGQSEAVLEGLRIKSSNSN